MSGEAFRRPVQGILCWPTDVPNRAAAKLGASTVTADCGHMVFMSPATKDVWESDKQVLAFCFRCAPEPTGGKYRMAPANYQEMVNTAGKAETDRRLAALGVTRIEDFE